MRTGTNVFNLLTDIKGESILKSEETTFYFVSGPNCPITTLLWAYGNKSLDRLLKEPCRCSWNGQGWKRWPADGWILVWNCLDAQQLWCPWDIHPAFVFASYLQPVWRWEDLKKKWFCCLDLSDKSDSWTDLLVAPAVMFRTRTKSTSCSHPYHLTFSRITVMTVPLLFVHSSNIY